MKNDIFNLQIISIDEILPQEEFDESRTQPLMEKIKKDGYFSNPIIVAQIDGKKYLQLDGMNRFSSMKLMGYTSVLTQVVDYNDQENVELSSWVHFFNSRDEDFISKLNAIPEISIEERAFEDVGHRYIKEEGEGRLCTLVSKDGKVWIVITSGNLTDKIKKLSQIVKLYSEKIERDVLPAHSNKSDIDLLFAEHQSSNMLCIFPTLTRHQIVEIVKKGCLLPPGISRHIIKRRCLNVNVPLAFFEKSKSAKENNKKFEEQLGNRKFRLYEESTIYFE